MSTPREHAQSIGGVQSANLSAPKTPEIPDPQRGKDPVLTQNQKERLLLDVKPPKPVPKPYR